jgi:hypothetical protein
MDCFPALYKAKPKDIQRMVASTGSIAHERREALKFQT